MTIDEAMSGSIHEAVSWVARKEDLAIGAGKLEQLSLYFAEMASWNLRTNLTGLKDPVDMVVKHLGDTAVLFRHLPGDTRRVMDLGTGAGVPGLILGILRDDLEITLVEAVKKKCSFLRFVVARLDLPSVSVLNRRIGPGEEIPGSPFDTIVTQATGSLVWLVSTARHLLAEEGRLIAMKGPAAQDELAELKAWLHGEGASSHLAVKVVQDMVRTTEAMRHLIFMESRRLRPVERPLDRA